MKFDKHFPIEQLRPYIKYFVVSESETANEYKVFPFAGLVIGFQYKGQLATIRGNTETRLASAGITRISDSYKVFKSSQGIGTVLIYFTEVGFTHFASHPANELFNLSLSLDEVFGKDSIDDVQEKLASAASHSF